MNAAKRVNDAIERNGRLPNYVTVGTERVYMPEFLGIMAEAVVDADNGIKREVARNNAQETGKTTEDSLTADELTRAEYTELAKSVLSYIDANGAAPGSIETENGTISYKTMLKLFAQINSVLRMTEELPESVAVPTW